MYKKVTTLCIRSFAIATAVAAFLSCHSGKGSQKEGAGQVNWPEVTHEMKPWTRWWWQGSAVTEKDLTAALESYQKAGLGGVEITPIYGVRGMEDQFIDFLSPEFMDKLTYTLQEAKRLGLGVDLANASGWPFGGPWVNQTDAAKGLYTKAFRVKEGETLKETLEYIQAPIVRTQGRKKVTIGELKEPLASNPNMQELALDQVRFERPLPLIIVTANRMDEGHWGETIDLTDKVKANRLDWVAPAGEWLICALYQGDHGKMVERAGPGGEGLVIDHFSSEALHRYLDVFDRAFAGHDLSGLRYYFNDSYEVDDAIGDADWTPGFFDAFEKLNHYDLKQFLPALLGMDTEDRNNRVAYDYRKTINELLLTEYTEQWQQWAAKQGKGIRNQSHGSPGNVLDLYAISDVPEIEGNDAVNLKAAASAAHVTGKRLVSSETCTWLDEHFESTLGQAKHVIDDFLLAGVNHMFYHGTTYSPQDAAWPGWMFYAAVHFAPSNSLWNDFGALNQYVARAQSFLQSGKPSNDILLYFPMADDWSKASKRRLLHLDSGNLFDGTTMKACGSYLSNKGYSWDAISDKQLLDVAYKDGVFNVGGNAYRTVMIPEVQYMPIETLEKLIALANEGANILIHKAMPADVPGLGRLEETRQRMEALTRPLSFTEEEGVRVAPQGKGRIVVSGKLDRLAAYADVQPESLYAQGLQSIRRVKEDGNYYYFIRNTTNEPFDSWIALNAPLGTAIVYNLMTGCAGHGAVCDQFGDTTIRLQLKPNECVVVETFRGKYAGELYPYYAAIEEAQVSLDKWTLTFVEGGPTLPEPLAPDQLQSWTAFGHDYAIFSGTAQYETRIPKLPADVKFWLLDLGEVHESASVYLNGKKIATLIEAPYTVEIPSELLPMNGELKIVVSNLMANRIIDLDKRQVEWKIFYNTNINARRKENAGQDGKFTAIRWTPRPSGLISTVSLQPLSVQ